MCLNVHAEAKICYPAVDQTIRRPMSPQKNKTDKSENQLEKLGGRYSALALKCHLECDSCCNCTQLGRVNLLFVAQAGQRAGACSLAKAEGGSPLKGQKAGLGFAVEISRGMKPRAALLLVATLVVSASVNRLLLAVQGHPRSCLKYTCVYEVSLPGNHQGLEMIACL